MCGIQYMLPTPAPLRNHGRSHRPSRLFLLSKRNSRRAPACSRSQPPSVIDNITIPTDEHLLFLPEPALGFLVRLVRLLWSPSIASTIALGVPPTERHGLGRSPAGKNARQHRWDVCRARPAQEGVGRPYEGQSPGRAKLGLIGEPAAMV